MICQANMNNSSILLFLPTSFMSRWQTKTDCSTMLFIYFLRRFFPLITVTISALMLTATAGVADADDALRTELSAQQGALISMAIAKDSTAHLDDAPLAISENGYIAFGFHRDDKAPQTLIITAADGTQKTMTLTPQERRYKTQSITGLAGKYVTPPEETLNRIAQDDFIRNGFLWPTKGIITGIYGSQRILNGQPRAPHYGIDIAAPTGTKVRAPADGIITLARDLYYTGGTLIIDHGLLISSTFLHLDSIDVSVGDVVTRGMTVGSVGSSGRSTGPHLDWRLNWGQKRLDPQLAAPPFQNN